MEIRRSLATTPDTMAPSALDLFILTFNCAKNLVNAATFASDLRGALSQNATGLPELVVFSLQEVAPMSYSFLGPRFLSPYYSRFEEALNLAAVTVLAGDDGDGGFDDPPLQARAETPPSARHSHPYTLIRAKNVGMTAILLFSKTPSAVHHIEEAECGFGSAGMGNKGAVGLRVTWSDDADQDAAPETTELTFVATHLTAMEWNLEKRNENWRRIMSGLTFENPRDVIADFPAPPGADPSNANSDEADSEETRDTAPLLDHRSDDSSQDDDGPSRSDRPRASLDHPDSEAEQIAKLHNLSIFKPTSHLFLAGDLNYRIGAETPSLEDDFPSFDTADPHHWSQFLPRDQLLQEKAAGRTLNGLSEANITFGPSYKYTVVSNPQDAVNAEAAESGHELPWKWARHRWPSWCDRVLYLDLPSWVRRRQAAAQADGEGQKKSTREMTVKAYDIMPLLKTSDHRPVFLRVRVPVLGPEEMAPPTSHPLEDGEATAGEQERAMDGLAGNEELDVLLEEDLADPRVSLPVPIDLYAWDRRAKGRRNEILSGLSMFLWGTREGAMFMATAALVSVGAWWLWTMW